MATGDPIDTTNAYAEQIKQLQVNMQQDQRQGTLYNMRRSEITEKWSDLVFGMYVNAEGRRNSFATLADNVLAVQALGTAGVGGAAMASLTAEIAELKAKLNDMTEIVVTALKADPPTA